MTSYHDYQQLTCILAIHDAYRDLATLLPLVPRRIGHIIINRSHQDSVTTSHALPVCIAHTTNELCSALTLEPTTDNSTPPPRLVSDLQRYGLCLRLVHICGHRDEFRCPLGNTPSPNTIYIRYHVARTSTCATILPTYLRTTTAPTTQNAVLVSYANTRTVSGWCLGLIWCNPAVPKPRPSWPPGI